MSAYTPLLINTGFVIGERAVGTVQVQQRTQDKNKWRKVGKFTPILMGEYRINETSDKKKTDSARALLVQNGGTAKAALFGRGEECSHQVPDMHISREHFALQMKPDSGEIRIVDIASTSGTGLQSPDGVIREEISSRTRYQATVSYHALPSDRHMVTFLPFRAYNQYRCVVKLRPWVLAMQREYAEEKKELRRKVVNFLCCLRNSAAYNHIQWTGPCAVGNIGHVLAEMLACEFTEKSRSQGAAAPCKKALQHKRKRRRRCAPK
ncbi:MAG: hypothetical protein CL450_07665 [Acidimicrobiaceae bacterium]|nr:hypothetical protein [Acidimicrobiaceae bacterium]